MGKYIFEYLPLDKKFRADVAKRTRNEPTANSNCEFAVATKPYQNTASFHSVLNWRANQSAM